MPSRKHVTRNVRGTLRKDLIKRLDSLNSRHTRSAVFTAFVHACAISISNQLAPSSRRTEREAEYLKISKTFGAQAMRAFSEALGLLQMAVVNEPGDILGDVYQGLGIANEYAGQFFTPYDVSRMIASMALGDIACTVAAAPRDQIFTICDPAVGGGGMLVAAVEHLNESSVPLERVCFYGTDVDARCVHMSYTQLALLSAPAIITHGNSITCETWDTWITPAAAAQIARIRASHAEPLTLFKLPQTKAS